MSEDLKDIFLVGVLWPLFLAAILTAGIYKWNRAINLQYVSRMAIYTHCEALKKEIGDLEAGRQAALETVAFFTKATEGDPSSAVRSIVSSHTAGDGGIIDGKIEKSPVSLPIKTRGAITFRALQGSTAGICSLWSDVSNQIPVATLSSWSLTPTDDRKRLEMEGTLIFLDYEITPKKK